MGSLVHFLRYSEVYDPELHKIHHRKEIINDLEERHIITDQQAVEYEMKHRRLRQMKLKKLAELAKDLPEFEHDIYVLNARRERFLNVKEDYTPKQIRETFYEIMCFCDSLGSTLTKLAEAYNKLRELILEAEIGD